MDYNHSVFFSIIFGTSCTNYIFSTCETQQTLNKPFIRAQKKTIEQTAKIEATMTL